MTNLKKFIKSFSFALNGIGYLFKNERNGRIHLFSALTAVSIGLILGLSPTEWAVLCLAIGLVISLEAINTSIEELCDHIHPDLHTSIKKVKDISAGAVLIAAFFALLVGLFIFIPKLLDLV